MPARSIIQTLETLIDLHKELNKLSVEKTEVIKVEDIKRLGSLLVQEKRMVGAVEKLEQVRQSQVHAFLQEKGLSDGSASLSACIQYASETEQAELNKLGSDLRDEITSLKERNELNQQLIYQSLQFVNLNLSLLLPEEASYTYERPQDAEDTRKQSQSLFDSKA